MDVVTELKKGNHAILKKLQPSYKINSTGLLIHYLAYGGDIKGLKMLKPNADDLMLQNNEGDNIAHIACKTSNLKMLEYILKGNINTVYQYNILDASPLYYIYNDIEAVRRIISRYDINGHVLKFNDDVRTTYYPVVYIKNDSIFPYCMYRISQYRQMYNFLNELSYDLTINENYIIKTIDYLVNNKMLDYNWKSNNNGIDVVFIKNRREALTNHMLKKMSEPSYFTLLNAVYMSFMSTIKLLLDMDIDVNRNGGELETAAHIMYYYGVARPPINIRKTILERTKNINIRETTNGSTVLLLILFRDDFHIMKDILENKKMDIHVRDNSGLKVKDSVRKVDMRSFYDTVYKSYINRLMTRDKFRDDMDNMLRDMLMNGQDISMYKKDIMHKIKTKQSYPLRRKDIKIMEIKLKHSPDYVFMNSNWITHVYILHVLDKHENVIIPLNKGVCNKYYDTKSQYIYSLVITSDALCNSHMHIESAVDYYIPTSSMENILSTIANTKCRFMFIYLGIPLHANMILLDITNKTIERFDSNGMLENADYADDILTRYFSDFLPDYTYNNMSKIVTLHGPQTYSIAEGRGMHGNSGDIGGFCFAWAFWYLEMRIGNSNISAQSLMKSMIKSINSKSNVFTDYIRDYAGYITESKNRYMKMFGLSQEYWYRLDERDIPTTIYDSYMKRYNLYLKDVLSKKLIKP